MGTDGKDFFVRMTRFVRDDIRLGVNLNYQRRNYYDFYGVAPETKREIATDLTWWLTSKTQLMFGYTFQRIYNPGTITAIAPYAETFTTGRATNHLLWSMISVQF
jgi:hypothetical protein